MEAHEMVVEFGRTFTGAPAVENGGLSATSWTTFQTHSIAASSQTRRSLRRSARLALSDRLNVIQGAPGGSPGGIFTIE